MGHLPEAKRYSGLLAEGVLTEVKPFHFTKDEKSSLADIFSEKLGLSENSRHVRSFLEAAERVVAGFKHFEELERKKPTSKAA